MKSLIREDGYVNATSLCKAGGKYFHDYFRNKKTKEYLKKLSEYLHTDKLIHTTKGGHSSSVFTHGT